ncbi:helix-turn-helix domain-containing protein [Streptomyces shenzhenensis]|uniref:Transcriptional regulator n=1 Tax=Streptomyces shenzhenensis TaxID=943815 RepID=A0A3M0I7Y3_9ACTN|nr:helix-turn-helix domain-containing protein [Streptomyces shenzhenensis]RMB84180.1 transcriptional regulator [Streptomyces shenzhenensis]
MFAEHTVDTNDVTPPPHPCETWPDNGRGFRETLDRIGDKWSVLVIGILSGGPLRFSTLHRRVPGISQRMLTLTLRHLERDGVVSRAVYAEVPPRVEYRLTPLGESLRATVHALAQWVTDHHEEIENARRRYGSV